MGEYAKLKATGQKVKIGTCENMYYLRFEDRHKVIYDYSFTGSRFRLPFPDEDNIVIGNYNDYDRGIDLIPYYDEELQTCIYFDDIYKEHYQEHKGLIQLKHENSGLMINASCYHGYKLPDNNDSKDLIPFFNGKSSSNFELSQVKIQLNEKTQVKELVPIVKCKHCKIPFRANWSSVLLHIRQHTKEDLELYNRLCEYATTTIEYINRVR